MVKKIHRFLIAFFALTLLSAFFIVPKTFAQDCKPGEAGTDLSNCLILNNQGQKVSAVYDTPAVLLNLVTQNIFIFGGIILFILIIYSGYQFITGGTKGQEQAKNIMTNAIAGFIVMFAAYWIIRIIEILTGVHILT